MSKSNMLSNNKIERSCSRIWKKSYLNQVVKMCREAGYDVVVEAERITIGFEDNGQVFLCALKANGAWLTRYDKALFDESLLEN